MKTYAVSLMQVSCPSILVLLVICGCSSLMRAEIADERATLHASATKDALDFFQSASGVVTDFPSLFDMEAKLRKRMREARKVIVTMQLQGASAGFLSQMQFYLGRMLSTTPLEDE